MSSKAILAVPFWLSTCIIFDSKYLTIGDLRPNSSGAKKINNPIYFPIYSHKAIVVITRMTKCFHDYIYIMSILLLSDLSTLCVVDHLWPLASLSHRFLLCWGQHIYYTNIFCYISIFLKRYFIRNAIMKNLGVNINCLLLSGTPEWGGDFYWFSNRWIGFKDTHEGNQENLALLK